MRDTACAHADTGTSEDLRSGEYHVTPKRQTHAPGWWQDGGKTGAGGGRNRATESATEGAGFCPVFGPSVRFQWRAVGEGAEGAALPLDWVTERSISVLKIYGGEEGW